MRRAQTDVVGLLKGFAENFLFFFSKFGFQIKLLQIDSGLKCTVSPGSPGFSEVICSWHAQ